MALHQTAIRPVMQLYCGTSITESVIGWQYLWSMLSKMHCLACTCRAVILQVGNLVRNRPLPWLQVEPGCTAGAAAWRQCWRGKPRSTQMASLRVLALGGRSSLID